MSSVDGDFQKRRGRAGGELKEPGTAVLFGVNMLLDQVEHKPRKDLKILKLHACAWEM